MATSPVKFILKLIIGICEDWEYYKKVGMAKRVECHDTYQVDAVASKETRCKHHTGSNPVPDTTPVKTIA